jgi:hypothetical protein
MDILDTMAEQPADGFDLADMNTSPIQTPAPIASIRNRAATAALLSDKPENIVASYQAQVAQAEQGDSGATDRSMEGFFKASGERDTQAVMSVLGDVNLSITQKQGAIEAMKKSRMLKDGGTSLASNGLAQASAGETLEAEDARISTADALQEMYNTRDTVQGLVNAHGASLSSDMTDATAGLLELALAPFATSVTSYKFAKDEANATGKKLSIWQSIKAMTFGAGTANMNIREKLAAIPPAGQVEYTKTILEIIKNNSGIMFSNDNQYNQFLRAQAVFAEGGYGSVDEFIDNASFLLDAIGVTQAMKAGKNVLKIASVAKAAATEAESAKIVTAGTKKALGQASGPSGFEAKVAPTPTQGANDAKITKLQEQAASLLGDAGNLADKGSVAKLRSERDALVKQLPSESLIKTTAKQLQDSEKLSYKDATAKATKLQNDQVAELNSRIKYLDNQIESNARAANASQRLSAIEKEIKQLEKSNTPEPMKLNPVADLIRRIDMNSVVRQESPSSVANIIQQANPMQARSLHEAVFKSSTDAVSEGMYGTSKVQALVNDVFPQAATTTKAVTSKVPDIQRGLRLDTELAGHLKDMLRRSDVAIHYSKEELAQARANIVHDFSHATDLVPNDAMGSFHSGFKVDGSGIEIGAVYGTKEGAFVRAEEAIAQAKYALRGEGVLDQDIEILKKQGLDYVPVNLEDVKGIDGSYLVRVNVRRDIDPTDIAKFEEDTVRLNFFDRNPLAVWNNTGSISRWMFDAASMLPKRLTGAATVATDITSHFEKAMLDIATQFSDQYNKLNKVRKAKLDGYIKEANFKEIAFDQTHLLADGFMANEISTLRSWRDFWDVHFALENYDVVRTLNSQGFQLFKNAQTELYARPIAKNTQLGKIYDPATGMVVNLAPNVLDDLYAKGGTIARLRRPTEFSFGMPNGTGTKTVSDSAEYMIVRNTPSEYLRKFRDTDEVLNYRDGYYQLQYSAPRFVDEISYGTDGKEIGRKAVAVAGDTKEAEQFAIRQRRLNPDKGYETRANDRGMARGSDDWFDVTATRGRIAQRHRGKLLEEATGLNHLGDGSYIVNPVESAIRASRSIAGRTVTRPMLETAKARFLQQFSDVLESDMMGGKKFPASVGEIGAKGKHEASHTADARTTWEYINYLENGYINTIDEYVKAQWNALATKLGEVGMSKTERLLLNASDGARGPTGFAKNFVFHAYIGTNVLRNWIVQTNQVVRTLAYNPKGWLTGSMHKLLGEYMGLKLNSLANASADGKSFTKFMDESGLLDSVDKQNLVRGSLLDAAGSSSKAVRVLGKVVEVPRKVGFDAGESMNLLGHGAAVFDRYRRAGKDMTDVAVLREAHSEVRAISYDMNFAGDMVYNQTSAAAILQFMQVPHKAFLQATNRRIPWEIRARMILADMVLWGTPAATISAMVGGDILPENKEIHEIFLHGVQGLLINKAWSELLGEDVSVDYSSLAPYDMDGWGKVFHAMMTTGLEGMLANSPAGQMFLADGGRVQSAIHQMTKFFSPWTPGERTPQEAAAVANEIAKISSGWNNAMKARQMVALKKSLDKYGNTVDPNVNTLEATMQLFGFTTTHARDIYATQRITAEGSKKYNDEVKQVYKEVKQYYQNAFEMGITDMTQYQAVTGQLLSAYKDSPQAMDIIQKELDKDLQGKDSQLMLMMLKSVDLPKYGITIDQIKKAPISDEQKEMYIKRLEDMRNVRSEINKDK